VREIGSFRRMFKGFRPALEGQGKLLGGSIGITTLLVGLDILRPWPIKFLFDWVIMPKKGPSHGPPAGLAPETIVAGVCIAVLLVSVGIGFLSVWNAILVARVGRKVATRIRSRVFEHMHRLDFPFHVSSHSGDLLQRLMGDVNMVKELLFASWASLYERALVFTGTAVVMFVIAPGLSFVALLPLPLLFLGLTRSSRKLTSLTRKQRRKQGDLASFAAETLRQIRLVKAYAGEDRATKHFTRQTRSSDRAEMKAARVAATMGRTAEILTGLGLAIVLFLGARQVLGGSLSPGSLVLLISYTRSLYKPVRKLPREGVRLSKATACAGRLLEVLDIPTEPLGAGIPAPAFRGEIRIEEVVKRYDSGVVALRGLSAAIPAGVLAVISGPNGAGKSTLVSLLLRLDEPDSGTIQIDGVPIREFQIESYRNRIAYVPQEIHLFGSSVADNILYGNPEASDEEVEAAASIALASDFIEDLPEGYDTLLGESGATVSGGEGRRIMLARAALRNASLLLLDEPLAGLDPAARATVAKAIRRIAAGRTTLVVSHGPVEEISPDLHLAIREGKIVESRFLRSPGVPG